jgi:hypothetical protein
MSDPWESFGEVFAVLCQQCYIAKLCKEFVSALDVFKATFGLLASY